METKRVAKTYRIRAKLWLYPGNSGAWHFVTIPKKESKAITEKFSTFKKGWGSLPVTVTIKKTTWTTSIFPDRKSATYLLPIKATVRRAEGLFEGDAVTLTLTIMT